MFDEKLTHKYWDENDSENFFDSEDSYVLLK